MNKSPIVFFLKSETVDISRYTIKNIPGSSGRFDVVSRCILAALMGPDRFEEDVQIWVFLDKYKTYIFDTNQLNYESFPKNELLLTDSFVDLIRKDYSKIEIKDNPLKFVKISTINIINALKQFINSNDDVFVLKENGEDFFKRVNELRSKERIVFVIGNQSGDFLNSEELFLLKIPNLSLGSLSYLASSIIRLIKLSLI